MCIRDRKYNSYLKTASGYASSLKACTYLYDDGVKIFITLCTVSYTHLDVYKRQSRHRLHTVMSKDGAMILHISSLWDKKQKHLLTDVYKRQDQQ